MAGKSRDIAKLKGWITHTAWATVAASLVFVALPELDLDIARLFYLADGGFTAASDPFLVGIRWVGQWLPVVAIVGILAALVAPALERRFASRVFVGATLFLATSLAVGPGLLVNALFKTVWGRARPRALLEFGGDTVFTPAWQIADQCQRNCSFISGEAASSAWFIAFALLAPFAWRGPIALAAGGFAFVMSANRVVFGAHFVSDVVVAWGATMLVILICHRIFLGEGSAAVVDPLIRRYALLRRRLRRPRARVAIPAQA